MTDRGAPAYGNVDQPSARGGVIAAVDPGGPAQRGGLEPGDRVLTANGLALRDVIDWRWNADEGTVSLLGQRGGQRFATTLERAPGETWGLDFAAPVFDRVRTCANDCAFCFMTQLPAGLRPSLYLRDDDYRLSWLAGTFVTLTNLTDADVARIIEQRLSPLYLSLHAVSPQARAALVRCRAQDHALERFDELAAAVVRFHVQIVLVPGVNDGDELTRTLGWLATRQEAVESVGVVPLGYTRHQDRFDASYEQPLDAAAVVEALRPWQERAREVRGDTWLQAADEFYLAAGLPVPPADDYDGFPQYENGIGMVRVFLDEWASTLAEREDAGSGAAAEGGPGAAAEGVPGAAAEGPATRRAVLVTGELFAPVLEGAVAGLPEAASTLRVLAVPNAFMGGNVSVAGLLTGEDLVAAIAADAAAARDRGETPWDYLVPDLVLNDDGVTLDGVPATDLGTRAEAQVRVVSSDAPGLLAELGLGAAPPDARQHTHPDPRAERQPCLYPSSP